MLLFSMYCTYQNLFDLLTAMNMYGADLFIYQISNSKAKKKRH